MKNKKTVSGLYKYKLEILDSIILSLYFRKLKPGERSLKIVLLKQLCSFAQEIKIYGKCPESSLRQIKEMTVANVKVIRGNLLQ